MNKSEKLEVIYSHIADKTLSFGCRIHVIAMDENGKEDAVDVIVNYIDKETWLLRDTELNSCTLWDIVKVIWHPVMINRIEWYFKKNNIENQLIEFKDSLTLDEYIIPIDEMREETIDSLYDILLNVWHK